MRVVLVEVRGFRNLADAEVRLSPGVNLIHGPNGAGKTNLLEALHFALCNSSCRTRNAREMIAFGAEMARAQATLDGGREGELRLLASIARDGERRRLADPPDRAAIPTTVFLPDRLELVKGSPALRRRQLDRVIAALWPARAGLRSRYGRALAQRNALIARIRAGTAQASALDAWDAELAAEGAELMASRDEAATALAEPLAEAASELGLTDAAVAYRPRSKAADAAGLADELGQRRHSDLARGYSGHGPHLDDLELTLDGRNARRFSSQGQQRAILLALLLAERAAAKERGAPSPPLLLDDVMSELDPEHRERLAGRLRACGQVVVTATEPAQMPAAGAATGIAVREGKVTTPLAAAA